LESREMKTRMKAILASNVVLTTVKAALASEQSS